jgi:serine/threonine protein kinase
MGEVYCARDTRLGRIVAIKVSTQEFGERLGREARVTASLNHPNICQLCDVGSNYLYDGVPSETLAARLAKGVLPLDQVLGVAIQIAGALDAAHRTAVVHRDLKPANVMLTKSGPKLLDFGLARIERQTAFSDETMTIAITDLVRFWEPSNTCLPSNWGQGNGFTHRHFCIRSGSVRNVDRAQGVRGPKLRQPDRRRYDFGTGCRFRVSADDSCGTGSRGEAVFAKARDDRWQTARDLCEEFKWIIQARGGWLRAERPQPSQEPALAARWHFGFGPNRCDRSGRHGGLD